jgi:hemoglobin
MINIKNIACTAFTICLGVALAGCGSGQKANPRGFFTSGSRESDQRADQRMALTQQTRDSKTNDNGKPQPEAPKSLYDRLGGEKGVTAIVNDFVDRALADPRVNWERKGVKKGGVIKRTKSVEWNASAENVQQLKKHIMQFISLSTGGPNFYDGREMKDSHAGLHITNGEFDAAVGDLKASMDKLQVGDKEQRELLSIIESTRTQIVEER